jgi:hypothetical protein
MLKTIILAIITAASLLLASVVSVRDWDSSRAYSANNIVIHEGKAYLAMQNVSAGDIPRRSGGWRNIVGYANPGNYRHDSTYLAGDVVRLFNREVYVARRWSTYTQPDKNDAWGAWLFVSNYAPPSGPFTKLPPHPGEAGKATILGIDSEGHGIRDDILIAVTRLIPDDPQKRAAALFSFKVDQELFAALLKDTTQTFEQLRPYFVIGAARARYWIDNDVDESIPDHIYNALLYNTRERFEMLRKISRLANGKYFDSFGSLPVDIQEKYNKMFQEVHEREKERQK